MGEKKKVCPYADGSPDSGKCTRVKKGWSGWVCPILDQYHEENYSCEELTEKQYYLICKATDYIPDPGKPRILTILGLTLEIDTCWNCPLHFTDDEQNGQHCALNNIPEISVKGIYTSDTDYSGFPEIPDEPFPPCCPLKKSE